MVRVKARLVVIQVWVIEVGDGHDGSWWIEGNGSNGNLYSALCIQVDPSRGNTTPFNPDLRQLQLSPR